MVRTLANLAFLAIYQRCLAELRTGGQGSLRSCNGHSWSLVADSELTAAQVASKRLQNAKSDKYHDNIHKRGRVAETTKV